MRIIRGVHRARKIVAPKNIKARPTTDFAKEALFNILENQFDFEEMTILDLFAGTGNISFEFASRGCKSVVSVDIAQASAKFISKTADMLDFQSLKAIKQDAFRFIRTWTHKFDLIFCDPPYDMEEVIKLPAAIFENELLERGGTLIIEHSEYINFEKEEYFLEKRSYGKVNFSFFSA